MSKPDKFEMCNMNAILQTAFDLLLINIFFIFIDAFLPEKPKLKFLNKVPNFKKAKKEMKRLRDIQGPAKTANTFSIGQYAIVVSKVFIIYLNMVVCIDLI